MPPGLDLRDAAAIPVVALTGTQLIEETANVQSGQTVLVAGALAHQAVAHDPLEKRTKQPS